MPVQIVIYLLILNCLISCQPGPKTGKSTLKKIVPMHDVAAKGFSIQKFGSWQKVTVVDPWQKSVDTYFDYFLVKKGEKVPEEIKQKHIFFTPLSQVICLSTTHIGFLDALGEVASITGLSGSKYLTNKEVNRGVAENRIREVGYESGLNYEMILQLKPEVVFAFGVGSEINAQINKLQDLGIQVVLVGEYLEQSPLAKAEWIKFFGAFFGKEKLAEDVYAKISTNYNAIRATVADETDKPAVLTGLPFKDTWWMAGGQSNLAVLISDAGGEFLWKENQSEEAFPVSLEEVFLRASRADFWINCGSVSTIDELMAHDQRFSAIPAVIKSQVYNNNLRSTTKGGSDYWESGVVHPDLVLADLVAILHPEKSVNKELYYYKKIVNK